MKNIQNFDSLNDISPNVRVYAWWHQVVLMTIVLIFPLITTGSIIGVGVYFHFSRGIVISGGLIFYIISLLLSVMLVIKIAPTDFMYVEKHAIIGRRLGRIPFESIVKYNLDGNRIKIHRRECATLRLIAIKKDNNYEKFHSAFVSAAAAWRVLYPGRGMEPAYFYGSWKAKIVGGLFLFSGACLAVASLAFDLLGGLAFSLLAAAMGFFMLLSRRRDQP